MPAPRNREQFAALVNDARRRQYLSIRAVARVAQVPATTIQGWLDGRHFPSPALRPNYLLLVNHLGLDDEVPDDIWDDSRA
jgi:DNA-binding transcriptional regulator YiaG